MRPAETPPATFAGQQYVDSAGCLFLRAGSKGETVWVPRVARDGGVLCGFPPSGRRVPIAGEASPLAVPTVQDQAPVQENAAGPATGTILMAIGSFSKVENADRAERRITELGLPVTRKQVMHNGMQLTSILAGPFESAASASAALAKVRSAGFSDAMLVSP
ncbi:SPOR domain-containing protein [Tabrizicola sp. BL-A-41-H6]|uniref:SPOR domain-containing protein n=1 Tax=Tabrizicola sp. BL-A-41-H6 TaxID=3421107 RepID=UPI003D66F23D